MMFALSKHVSILFYYQIYIQKMIIPNNGVQKMHYVDAANCSGAQKIR